MTASAPIGLVPRDSMVLCPLVSEKLPFL
uniref:Uncharacterized protein n=1 Tax=Arundo donax TaxID=35708 RepID=A0A0A9GEE7_ARUDO